jgi:hypothetical protein
MKAMRKVSRGAGFRGALNYVFGRSKEERDAGAPPGRPLGGNMLGHDPRSLSAEFKLSRELRQDVAKPVWHQALRLPPGEEISDQQWVAFGDDYMAGMGFTDQHQRVYVLHADEPALHIVASRIALDGSLYLGKNENLQTTKLVAELEKKHGLRITVTADIDPKTGLPSTRSTKDRRDPKKGEIEKALRTGLQPARMQIQNAIDAAVAAVPHNLDEFRTHLSAAGVTLHVHNHPETGEPRGLSFECDGSRFSGSQLGNDYKFQNLQRRIDDAQFLKNRASAPVADLARSSAGDQASRRLDGRSTGNPEQDQRARETHRGAGSAHRSSGAAPDRTPGAHQVETPAAARTAAHTKRSDEMMGFLKKNPPAAPAAPAPAPTQPTAAPQVQVQGSISSSLPPALSPVINPCDAPTLGGRLMAVRLMDGKSYDLFWRDRTDGKPSFRWQSEQQRLLILAQPNEKNVQALFDAAQEKGIGMPQITISGTPEFQRLAAAEAAKRGLPVDTAKMDPSAREIYSQTWAAHHGETANAICSSAYESQAAEEARRAAEAAALREKQGNDDGDDGDGDRGPGDPKMRG